MGGAVSTVKERVSNAASALFGNSHSYRQSSQSVPSSPPTLNPLTDVPWRDVRALKWTDEYAEKLRNDVKQEQPMESTRVGICMLGPVGAGKSSFVNSVMSISKGRIATPAYTGGGAKSYTTGYGKYSDRFFGTFTLCDTMGLEKVSEEGFNVQDLMYMIKGHVPTNYQFNPRAPISEKTPGFIKHPADKDKIFCVVYVVAADALFAELPQATLDKVMLLQKEVKDAGISRVLIITKVDLVCPEVKRDIRNIYRSAKVQEAVQIAAEVFNLAEQNIHPVKNYCDEVDIHPLKHIPLLYALRQMLTVTEDYLEHRS